MFFKEAKKKNVKDGKIFSQFQLVRTARIDGKVKHKSVLYIGAEPKLIDKVFRKKVSTLLESYIYGETLLDHNEFPSDAIDLAKVFFEKFKIKHPDGDYKKEDDNKLPINYQPIDFSSTRVEQSRTIGAEWLVLQMANRLEFSEALQSIGWKNDKIKLALCSVISKAVFPESENKTALWLNDNSGLASLLEFKRCPNRHQLYNIADDLYQQKPFLEKHLYQKTLQLFDIEDTLMIYDLTNTYMEGRKVGSELCAYGRSKEKRNDCKQVVLAAVVNKEGFLKHSKIFKGNMSDISSFSTVLDELLKFSGKATNQKQTIVFDAGIASEENLKLVSDKKLKYVCVSRRKLKNYCAQFDGTAVKVYDNRDKEISLKIHTNKDEEDLWMEVLSDGKKNKETGIDQQSKKRFIAQLTKVQEALSKPRGTKMYGKVMERLGRIKEKYSRAQSHYTINVERKDDLVVQLSWVEKSTKKRSPGQYFIRTNHAEADEKQLWGIYNTIREVEAAFRCLKTDLNLRPVYHQNDNRIESHLFLGILAYQLVSPILHQLKQAGQPRSWSEISRIMRSQTICDITQKGHNKDLYGQVISEPIKEVSDIYRSLNFKSKPKLKRRKDVVYR